MMRGVATAVCTGTLLLATQGRAIDVGGIALAPRRGELTLHGAGLLRKGFIFKIYVGALYLAQPADADRVLERVPKRLDIHYFHHTPRKHMIRVAEQTLRENLTASEYAALESMIDQLHAVYRDGRNGGWASLWYRPGTGLTYLVDGEELLTIPDDRFANAYFQVWLGAHPSSATMKAALLRKLESTS